MNRTKSRKQEITKDSILDAISKGAKSLTQIAHLHGHIGSVSSTVTAKFRKLVPDVADRLAGKPAVMVAQRKDVYGGMYGLVFKAATKAGEVAVKAFIPKAATAIMWDPACAKAVAKIKAKVGDGDLVAALRKSITFAIGVIRSPNHTSNMGRSKDASSKRGVMRIVALEG